jgi:hypothetical protein
MKNQSVTNNLDWISVILYLVLVIMGWLNIYSSSLALSDSNFIFDFCDVNVYRPGCFRLAYNYKFGKDNNRRVLDTGQFKGIISSDST